MCVVESNPNQPSGNSCSFGVGGTCNATTLQCDCKEGYTHDLFSLRQRDCSLPVFLMPIIFGYVLIASIACLFFSLIKLGKAEGMSRHIILASASAQVCVIGGAIMNFLNEFVITSAIGVSVFLMLGLMLLSCYMSLYSMASPLYRMADAPEEHFLMALKATFSLFRTIQFSLLITEISLFGDYTKAENDYGWSVISAIMMGFYGIEALVMFIMNYTVGKKMIALIDILLQQSPANQNHKITREYLKKVELYHKSAIVLSPGPIMVTLLIPIVYISLGYFPLSYVLVAPVFLNFPAISYFVIKYATRDSDINQTQVTTRVAGYGPDSDKRILSDNDSSKKTEHDMKYTNDTKYLATIYEESKT